MWCVEKLLVYAALFLLCYRFHWCIDYLETYASHFQFSWYWNCAGNELDGRGSYTSTYGKRETAYLVDGAETERKE